MFFIDLLYKDICIELDNLNGDIKKLFEKKIEDLTGTIYGNRGLVTEILEINQLSKGKIDNETGKVFYKIEFKAIMFKLIENEILYAKPYYINPYGFFCKIGPCNIFVSKHTIPTYTYDKNKNTWNGEEIIEIDKSILLKIIMVKNNSNEITSLATVYTK